jgi:sugar phosphate permease
MAVPLGGAALVLVAQFLLGSGLGWWQVYYAFAAFMLIALLPLCMLFLRRRPEDMGLLPDGDKTAVPDGGPVAVGSGHETSWTLAAALRTRALWFLIVSTSVGVCVNGAISFHLFAFYKDQGVAAAAAATAISVYALSGALASGIWGFLVERVPERIVGAATVALAGLTCLYLLTVDTPLEAMVFAVLFGLLARGEGSIIAMMEASYFGRAAYGSISGFASPFQQISLALGPTFAAVIYDATGGSYSTAFSLFAAMYLGSALLIWYAKRPARPAASS